MRLIDFYIAKSMSQQILLVISVLLGLFLFVNFLDQLGSIGNGRFSIGDAIKYVLLTAPRTLYDLFPTAALLGTILALGQMATDSELVILRASGVSIFRIIVSVLKVGAGLALIAILLGEFVTPVTETLAQRERAEALQTNIEQQGNFGLWMRDSESFVNVGEVLPDLTLLNIRLFEFDSGQKLRALAHAKEAIYEDNSRWRLSGVKQTIIDRERGQTSDVSEALWKTSVTPEILQVFLISPDQLSLRQLSRYIGHLQENNQSTAKFNLAYWGKIVLPFATAVMVVLAIPFVFGQIRSGSLGRSLFVGIMVGLVFYVADRAFGYLVLVYDIVPFIGAIIPTLSGLAVRDLFRLACRRNSLADHRSCQAS